MKNNEQQIQKQVIDYLTLNGWLVWKNKNTNRGTGIYLPTHQKGVPDLTALRNGQVVFIEVKTETGKSSSYQEEFQFDITWHGGIYRIVRSVKDAESINKQFGKGERR